MKYTTNFLLASLLVFICQTVGLAEELGPQYGELYSFEFKASVDMITGVPSVPVKEGDLLEGTFDYFQRESTSVQPTRGCYPQVDPAGVSFRLNSLAFKSEVKRPVDFMIDVNNDDAMNTSLVRDQFGWGATSSSFDSGLDIKHVGVIFYLVDTSARVFSDTSLPSFLDLKDFTSGQMFINADTESGKQWHIRLRVTDISKR